MPSEVVVRMPESEAANLKKPGLRAVRNMADVPPIDSPTTPRVCVVRQSFSRMGGSSLVRNVSPLVVLAVVGLEPVGVEAGLTADREDDVDVLVRVEGLGVGLVGPGVLVVGRAKTVEHPDRGEAGRRIDVPIAGQEDLHLNRGAHRGRVHPQRDATLAEPVDLRDRCSGGVLGGGRCGLSRCRRGCRGSGRRQARGDRQNQHRCQCADDLCPEGCPGPATVLRGKAYSHELTLFPYVRSARRSCGRLSSQTPVETISTRKRSPLGVAALLLVVQLLLTSGACAAPEYTSAVPVLLRGVRNGTGEVTRSRDRARSPSVHGVEDLAASLPQLCRPVRPRVRAVGREAVGGRDTQRVHADLECTGC